MALEGSAQRTEVVVVDDHALVSEILTFALSVRDVGVAQVCVASHTSRADIVEAVGSLDPRLVLLDLHLGDTLGDGRPLIPGLRALGTEVLVLTAETDRAEWAACVVAGAIGVVGKSVSFESLAELIARALRGESVIGETERASLATAWREHLSQQEAEAAPFNRLTPREEQVLAALIEGKVATAIAAELYTSVLTVRTHIRSIREKLEVHSQVAAVALALAAHWPGPGRTHPSAG